MKTLAVNEKNDIYIGADGKLAIATDLQAVIFSCQQAAKARLGEMLYAFDQGIPMFETVFLSTANVPQYSAALRIALESVPNVTEVTQLDVTVANNVLNYVAYITTPYGQGIVNG